MADLLQKAIEENNVKKVEKLLKREEVKQALGQSFGEHEVSYLHEACKKGQTDLVKVLIKNGLPVNQPSNIGWTPLHKASAWGNPQCVEILLQNEANVNVTTDSLNTPLHLVAQKTLIVYLKTNGKSKEINYKEINKNYREVTKLLIAKGSDIDARNDVGRTPLHISAGEGFLDICYILYQSKADVNVKDNNQQTPVDVARACKKYDVVEWFLEMEISEEKLARQDLARLAAAEHEKLENRLIEIVEEHEGELAEQRAQLLQAYKIDIKTHEEEVREKLLQEMSQREDVIVQLNSLIKAERQNMDNDHLTYQKQVVQTHHSVKAMQVERESLRKMIQDLEAKYQEKAQFSDEQSSKLQEVTSELEDLQLQCEGQVEDHKAELDKVSSQYKQNILLLQQTVDNLNVDLSTQLGLCEDKENTILQLQTKLSEQSTQNQELVQKIEAKQVELETIQSQDIVAKEEVVKLKSQNDTAFSESEALKLELTKLKEESKQIMESERNKFQQLLQQKDVELDNIKSQTQDGDKLKSKHQAELQHYQKQLDQLKESHSAELEGYKKKLQDLEMQNVAKIKELEDLHAANLVKSSREIEVLVQSKESELASMKTQTASDMTVKEEKFQAEIQQLRSQHASELQELKGKLQGKDSEIAALKEDNIVKLKQQEDIMKEQIQQSESGHNKRLGEMQQKMTEKEKEVVILTTQLKSHTESIRNFESSTQQLKQRHAEELKQAEARLMAQHKSDLEAMKSSLHQQHQTELTQLKAHLDQQYESKMADRENVLEQQHKLRLGETQREFAQKQSTLQQEMFKVAGAEQAKLKQQHEAKVRELQTGYEAKMQGMNEALKTEESKYQNITKQLQDSERSLQQLQNKFDAENQKHSQKLSDLRSEQERVSGQYQESLRLKEDELRNSKTELKRASQQLTEVQKKLEDTEKQRVKDQDGFKQGTQQEITQLKKTIQDKEETIQTINSQIKQQDSVIKSYVLENTKLKDEHTEYKEAMDSEIQKLNQKVQEKETLLQQSRQDVVEAQAKVETLQHSQSTGMQNGRHEDRMHHEKEEYILAKENVNDNTSDHDESFDNENEAANDLPNGIHESESALNNHGDKPSRSNHGDKPTNGHSVKEMMQKFQESV